MAGIAAAAAAAGLFGQLGAKYLVVAVVVGYVGRSRCDVVCYYCDHCCYLNLCIGRPFVYRCHK